MADELFEKGLRIRDEMLGPEHGSAKLAQIDEFARDFEDLVTRHCFGYVWGREQLPRAIRSMLTIAMVVAMGRAREVRVHVRGAITNGATETEIRETLLQAAVYCGMPAAMEAFRRAEAVLSGSSTDGAAAS